MTKCRKKLIEVAFPPDAINEAVAQAVIFVQMEDNLSACPKFLPTLGPQ